MVAVVGHRDRLGEPLGLVVAAPRTDRVDVAPVVFALGVDLGIAVDLGRAGQQEPRVLGLREPERVVGAERAHLECRDGVSEIVDRTGWTGEMQHVVDRAVDLDRLGDIVLEESKRRVVDQVRDVAAIAGQEVVHADDFIAVTQESLAKV